MSSVPSFAYRPGCAYNCFVNLSETLKCHNFLILHPILMKFSVLCLFDFSLFIQINFLLGWTCPLKDGREKSKQLYERAKAQEAGDQGVPSIDIQGPPCDMKVVRMPVPY